MKFIGILKQILDKILRIFEKNFENFWENFALTIIKLIQFQYNLLKFWVDFKKIFSKFEKNANAKRVEKIFRIFFHAFFKYRKYCGWVSILSNLAWYRYFHHHYTLLIRLVIFTTVFGRFILPVATLSHCQCYQKSVKGKLATNFMDKLCVFAL